MHFRILCLGLMVAGCGTPGGNENTGGGTGTGGGSNQVTCTPTAGLTNEVSNNRTVLTASGSASCTGATSIDLEVCLQRQDGANFVDLKCVTGAQSDVTTLSNSTQSGCIGSLTVRTRAVVNGQEALSSELTVTCL